MVFVIAEAGIAHDGDLRKALDLIDTAKKSGANAVKFQTFNAAKLAERRKNAALASKLKPYEMPLSWLPMLRVHADKAGIEFMTTCFDVDTLKVAAPLLKRFKIGHGESWDKEFYEAHLEYGKQIIASVCESKMDGWDAPGSDTRHLFCVDKYPTPIDEADLRGIIEAGCDGYSDHTRNEMTGMMAVAAGAKIVEVHFGALNPENPDYCVSLSGYELQMYVCHIRHAEKAVYGVALEETRKLERPESAPRTSHPQASAGSSPAGARPGELF